MKKILISGGWGHPPEFYNIYFGEYEVYFIDDFDSSMVFDAAICWSMGTLKYFDMMHLIKAEKIVLISPTFDFMFGRDIESLQNIITGMKINPEKTIRNFCLSCFYNKNIGRNFYKKNKDLFLKQDKNKLIEDLKYLKEKKVQVSEITLENVFIFSAENDDIIPNFQTEEVQNVFSKAVSYNYRECGHNIFEENKEVFIKELRGIIGDK